jgi:ribose 5-phosphate isomerase B
MRVAVAADERSALAQFLIEELLERGHEPLLHGALLEGDRADWAWGSAAAAEDVVAGRADQAIVCCWTGTGAAIAANKVAGVRAALCGDAVTAAGARRWNDANVLALSLRAVGEGVLGEILDAWFATAASTEQGDRANVEHLAELDDERRPRCGPQAALSCESARAPRHAGAPCLRARRATRGTTAAAARCWTGGR